MIVPVLALMINPGGALANVNVHDGLAHVEASARVTVAPKVEVGASGVEIVGAAKTVQVKLVVDTVAPDASVMVTVVALNV